MLSQKQIKKARKRAAKMLKQAGIIITKDENSNMEIADFGLGRLEEEGLEVIVYVNTDRYCAKELILFPYQICPEHRHPEVESKPGKMETFRCRWGKVWLYIKGEATAKIKAKIPKKSKPYYTVFKEIVLNPGQQYTIPFDTLHWFQAGAKGAIVSEFSSASHDESDIFTNPNIQRIPD